MAETHICPQGHQFESSGDPSASTLPVSCPVCSSIFDVPPPPVTAPLPPPVIKGYEILAELGRGGMGIVYRARQPALDRLVALKMIRDSVLAGPEEVTRFRVEAQAVAQLQHPNFVQIFEVGETDGRPFFSMEYVEGDNLARQIAGNPWPADRAAELAETLCRAMHHAHQRGIVHRDLKPANILLSVVSCPSSVAADHGPRTTDHGLIPKITDFGLAKRLESDSAQTRSGAIMGTPSYMAPEQAAGRVREIGPLTDVYALGAILYELLTGQPPFRGESAMDTLLLIASREPTPPRKLNPKVPHDLETICLKALAKAPAGRYASALAMAEDLARFRAGEPILGRREGLARKVFRKVRRQPLTAAIVLGAAVAVLAAAVVAGYYAPRYLSQAQRITALNQQIEAGLQDPQMSDNYLQEMQDHIDQLEELDPTQAELARTRLHQQFARSIADAFAEGRGGLQEAEVAKIEAALVRLETLDPGLAGDVRRQFKDRLSRPDLHSLPPLDRLATLFDPKTVKVEGQTLQPLYPANHKGEPIVRLRLSCQGPVQLEAVFERSSWEKVDQLGLLLNVTDSRKGYGFVLRGVEPAAAADRPPMQLGLGPARKTLGLRLTILRSGIIQREQAVTVTDGPLHLRASRNGDLLTFQVNDQSAMQFRDAFPPSEKEAGVFGLLWPAGVGLERLSARRQATPAAPSPLEKGNDLLAQGNFALALDYFRAQADAARDREVRQEARCKEAYCLAELNRTDEAAPLLTQLANETGPRWPAWAACQLWLLRLKQKDHAEADALFTVLANRYRPEQLAVVISAEVRQAIWESYAIESTGHNLLTYLNKPERARRLEQTAVIQDLILGDPLRLALLKKSLSHAYRCAGLNENAYRVLQELVSKKDGVPPQVIEEYCWLLRERGEAKVGLEFLKTKLADKARNREYHALLLEQARSHVALGDWSAAEKDLDQLFRSGAPGLSYRFYSGGWLLWGFVKEHGGDPAGALEAWRKGLYRSSGSGGSVNELLREADNTAMLNFLILASLTGELSDADAEVLGYRLVSSATPENPASFLKALYKPLPAALREMWRTPRGRDAARKIAFQSVSFPEYIRLPVVLLGFEILHQGALPGDLTADQDAVLWRLCEDCFVAMIAGKFGKTEGLKYGLAWTTGVTGAFGWGGLAPTLDPNLRGPLAYCLGQRYRRFLKKPDDALKLFQSALADAPPGSPLQRLAQAELERVKEK